MSPETQTALPLNAKFGDFVLDTIPVPSPGREEVLVKVTSAALNPVDWKIQKYGWWIEKYPSVFGTDLAGEIVRLGEGVSTFEIGDKVFFQGSYGQSEYNGFQQYALADIHTIAKIPSNVSVDEAATIPVTITAAYVAFYSSKPNGLGLKAPVVPGGKGKYSGTPVVVLGGASSVGQFAIQLAKLSGFSPIITTASLKHEEFLKSLGATDVVDRNVPPTKENIQKLSEKPVEIVFDSIASSQTQEDGLNILGSGGELVTVLEIEERLLKKAAAQNTEMVHALGLKTLPFHVELLREFWAHATELLESGDIKPNRVEVLPNGLKAVTGGLERLFNNKVSGVKLVVRPQESA
ncbi:hypothetical protein D9611_002056 [Ephemerocybe angulata]|uniref:Enoyl reductase (ER) domain-containing protein n=1 Tax=Ephemerocybe angulata TaxID=980116 RepID=A0A8H5CHR6_9AGAR|nr:hypothetical protein D9611_002056 [Tulosesus angulatus]